MLNIRKSNERGHANHGWLDSYHTFSFGDYYDPNHMGFKTLRVINEDFVEAGAGFPTHPHRDMEIVTYVLDGALEHKDSMGTGSVIPAGDIQYMSAGSGVTHSEFNQSKKDRVHLLQIWILPNVAGAKPRYDQKSISRDERIGRFKLLVSEKGEDGSIAIRQDAKLYARIFKADETTSFALSEGRSSWVHVARGEIALNGKSLQAGDAAAITQESQLQFSKASADAEVLIFDLA
jgi:redox-sensitive bicupin YhaK (pirin superfamily)